MLDRQYLVISLFYAVAGLLMGIYMAAAKNHSLLVVHAHMMLLGFVVSFIYAVIYKTWLPRTSGSLAITQFCLHQVSALVMISGLFMLYAQIMPEPIVGPVLGVSSIGVLLGMLLMVVMVLKEKSVRAADYIVS
ncbi:MAG: TonB-dependent receptor [Cellvibrionaceae bacterium]|nr:TonB-dependent receptor [Cellvibrionaceae bacterium]